MITPNEIKALRERTGVSVMECKKALEEAGGNMEQALVILRKKSSAAAAKKSERTLGAGAVQAYVHANRKVGAMVLLSSETDFVSQNPEFVSLAYDIALHAAALQPRFIRRSDAREDDLAAARAVFEKEAAEKPEEMREKVIEGKMDAYLKEQVLLEQSFVKDPSHTISQLIEEAVQKFGERIEVSECVRFSVS